MSARHQRLNWVVERLAGLAALALYALLVSRGEALPYLGGARTLTIALVAVSLAGLIAWRLRAWLTWRAARSVLAPVAPVGLALLLGLALRLTIGGFFRPMEGLEARVLAAALQVIAAAPVVADDGPIAALGWLHAPVAAARYMSGASAGVWREIEDVPVEALLSWSRTLHLALGLGALGVVAHAARRLVAPRAALLAAALVAVSGAAIGAATRVDAAAPASLGASLALLAIPPLVVAQVARLPRWVKVVGVVSGVVGLWLPSLASAVFAPCLALLVAVLVDQLSPLGGHGDPSPACSGREESRPSE